MQQTHGPPGATDVDPSPAASSCTTWPSALRIAVDFALATRTSILAARGRIMRNDWRACADKSE